jgi:release factor glutamine methyltransferase
LDNGKPDDRAIGEGVSRELPLADGAGQAVGARLGTVETAINQAASILSAAGFDEPRRRARRLIGAALGRTAAEIFAHPEYRIGPSEQGRIVRFLDRVVAREPLSRVLGTREFWGLELALSADAFDPRPETETVVETVLARLPDRRLPYRFLDLGTGSGCLLLALLSEYPAATGIGVDRAPGAAATARENAGRLGLAARAAFIAGDWADAVAGSFDAVVSNPPYIATGTIPALPPEVREYDPHRALDGGIDGLAAYRAIAGQLPRLLSPGGLFAAEIGAGQGPAVSAILGSQGLVVDALVADLAGTARCILAHRIGRPD